YQALAIHDSTVDLWRREERISRAVPPSTFHGLSPPQAAAITASSAPACPEGIQRFPDLTYGYQTPSRPKRYWTPRPGMVQRLSLRLTSPYAAVRRSAASVTSSGPGFH